MKTSDTKLNRNNPPLPVIVSIDDNFLNYEENRASNNDSIGLDIRGSERRSKQKYYKKEPNNFERTLLKRSHDEKKKDSAWCYNTLKSDGVIKSI